jgi:FHS family L-fucose permease-like MFS transporter
MKFVRPRIIFLVYLSGVIAFNAASITQRGNVGLAMLMITLFFESVCFPTIVALGIRGLGRHSKVRHALYFDILLILMDNNPRREALAGL